MAVTFNDHFSAQSALYARARPHYPPQVFEWLAGCCVGRRLAWEPGCGNGQASAGLARHFERVIATDPSGAQIAEAPSIDGVAFRVEAAEAPSLADASADLVLVAQALHWFDQRAFHAAVARVLVDGGCFAALAYGLPRVTPEVDRVIDRLYHDTLHEHWPPERAHVDREYRDLPFPYQRITAPGFAMRQRWSLGELTAYLRSWSATQRYQRTTGHDPVAGEQQQLECAWQQDPEAGLLVTWPLHVLAGRKAAVG